MFGKRKTQQPEPEQELEMPEPPRPQVRAAKVPETETIDAEMLSHDKEQLLKNLISEFQGQYANIFGMDLQDKEADVITLNLLFGIYGELRLIRELLQQDKK